jgi:hypothetical protein
MKTYNMGEKRFEGYKGDWKGKQMVGDMLCIIYI